MTRSDFAIRMSASELRRKHKPQSDSVAGGVLLFFATSMHVAWTVWSPFVSRQWLGQARWSYFLMISSLHWAAIVGGCVGAAVVTRYGKKPIYYICCLLIAIGNLIIISFYDEPAPLITGRFCIGLAHGCLYVALIAHTGENSCASQRGRIVAALGSAQAVATACTLLVSLQFIEYSSIDSNQFVGVASVIIAILGAGMTMRHAHESVVYQLQKGHHEDVILGTLCRLRNEITLTVAVQNELDELRRQLELESTALAGGASPLRDGNWRPLLQVAGGLRLMHLLSDNVLVNAVQNGFMRAMWPAGGPGSAALIVCTLRALGTIGPRYLLDRLGRRPHLAVVAAGATVLLVLTLVLNVVDHRGMAGLLALFALAQTLYGLGGVDALPLVAAAEAFALAKKPWSLAVVAAVGHGGQVAAAAALQVVPATWPLYSAVLGAPAAVVVAMAAWLWWRMPETRAMTLAQCAAEWVGGRRLATVVYTREAVPVPEGGGGGGRAQAAEGITYA